MENENALPGNLQAELNAIYAGAESNDSGPIPELPTGADRWAAIVVEMGLPAFTIIAPAWGVTRAELQELGAGIAPALQKYMPMDDDFTLPLEIVAVAAVFVFASKHAGQPRKLIQVNPEGADNAAPGST